MTTRSPSHQPQPHRDTPNPRSTFISFTIFALPILLAAGYTLIDQSVQIRIQHSAEAISHPLGILDFARPYTWDRVIDVCSVLVVITAGLAGISWIVFGLVRIWSLIRK